MEKEQGNHTLSSILITAVGSASEHWYALQGIHSKYLRSHQGPEPMEETDCYRQN